MNTGTGTIRNRGTADRNGNFQFGIRNAECGIREVGMIDLNRPARGRKDEDEIGKVIAVMAPILMAVMFLIEWGLG